MLSKEPQINGNGSIEGFQDGYQYQRNQLLQLTYTGLRRRITTISLTIMMEKTTKAATPSIPLPKNHIRRTHSELQLAQDQILADYQDGQMYERILIGILRRCDETGICHPKTSSSLENIVNTKMQDYRSLDKSEVAENDLGDKEQNQSIHRSSSDEELPRLASSFTSLSSSKLECDRRNSSMPSFSCSASHMDDSTDKTHDIDSGIFVLEL